MAKEGLPVSDLKFFFKMIFIILVNAYLIYVVFDFFRTSGLVPGMIALAIYAALVAVAIRRRLS